MACTVYKKTALIGGTSAALDSIDGALLLDEDLAFVDLSGVLYVYRLDDDLGGAESSPNIIAPDTNPGNKRWVRQGTYGLLSTDSPTFAGLIVPSISPAANFILTQNSVAVMTSVGAAAVVNTLYLKEGKIGIGTPTPGSNLHLYSGVAGGAIVAIEQAVGVGSGIIQLKGTRTGASEDVGRILSYWNGNNVAEIRFDTGPDTTNKDDGAIGFFTSESGSSPQERVTILNTGTVGIGTVNPSQLLTLAQIETITGDKTDGYSAGLRLDPGYTAATALTVTRHNYIDVQNVSVAGAGPAAVTAAAVLRFDANIGTHKALAAAFNTTDSGAHTTAWAGGMLVNVNGVLYKIPLIAA